MTRVVLADDHNVLRVSLERLLNGIDGIEVVGSAANGFEAIRVVTDCRPDVVLMDLSMPEMDGVEATRQITASGLATKVVVLTSFTDRQRVLDALDAGAVGYLLKDSEPDDLVKGVRAASRGDWPLDPRAARLLLSEGTPQAAPSGRPTLSARELDVLRLLVDGLPNKTIARRLGIAERTVKAHLTHIYEQLSVHDRMQAVIWARAHGVLGS